jgi:hypothetical protein
MISIRGDLKTIRLPDIFDIADVRAGRAHVNVKTRGARVGPELPGDRIAEPKPRRDPERFVRIWCDGRPIFAKKGQTHFANTPRAFAHSMTAFESIESRQSSAQRCKISELAITDALECPPA